MVGSSFSTTQEKDQPPQQPQTHYGKRKIDEIVNWSFTEFFLSDLTAATKNFSSEDIISENAEESSNVVYKGLLLENLCSVAVKRFKNTPWDNPDNFSEDAEKVADLKHKRLVKLLGCCCEDQGLLVAEYMPNDTLAKRLFHHKNLEWSMRLRVAYHIAQALEYCKTAGLHWYDNLSANTVLFDKDGDACLSSFGLLREIFSYNRREGGNEETGNVTYRFGTILVNLLTGIQFAPSQAPEMINGKDVTELIDPNLNGGYSKEEATIVLKLASECLQCKDDTESFITKEVVATLEALQAKKDNEVASSSQQQPSEEVLSSETPEIHPESSSEVKQASSSSSFGRPDIVYESSSEVERGTTSSEDEEASTSTF